MERFIKLGTFQEPRVVKFLNELSRLQQQLKAQRFKHSAEADESTTGPVSLIALDTDGDQILVDQYAWTLELVVNIRDHVQPTQGIALR